MRNGFLGALAGWLTWSGLAVAQGYLPPYVPDVGRMAPPSYVAPHGMVPPPPAVYAAPYPYPMPSPMPPMPPMQPMPVPFTPPAVRGWPPPPGSFPSTGWIELASATAPEPAKKEWKAKGLIKRKESRPATSPTNDRIHTARRQSDAPMKAAPEPPPVTPPTPGGCPEPYEVQIDPHPGTPLMCAPLICTPALPPHEITHPEDPNRAPPTYHWYGEADYLFWLVKKQNSPVLLAVTEPGGPTFLISGSSPEFDNFERAGGMFTMGGWLNPCHTLALEGTFLFLGERTPSLTRSSNGTTILTKPFVNTFPPFLGPSAFIIAAPGFPGTATIDGLSRLWSAEANLRWAFIRTWWGHLDCLAGFRYFELEENLNITAVSTFPGATGADRFGTTNEFFGGQLGVEGEINFGRWFLDAWAKVAFGQNHQVVNIQAEGNGFFANVGNVGRREFDRLTVLPAAGITTGARVSEHLRLTAGYSILFLNNAVRPGEHINSNIAVGPIAPGIGVLSFFERRESHFWAQGAHVGLEFRY